MTLRVASRPGVAVKWRAVPCRRYAAASGGAVSQGPLVDGLKTGSFRLKTQKSGSSQRAKGFRIRHILCGRNQEANGIMSCCAEASAISSPPSLRKSARTVMICLVAVTTRASIISGCARPTRTKLAERPDFFGTLLKRLFSRNGSLTDLYTPESDRQERVQIWPSRSPIEIDGDAALEVIMARWKMFEGR